MEVTNMKKVKVLAAVILLTFVSIIAINCDPSYFKEGCHSYAKLENNSNISICADFTKNYPDTTLNDNNPLRRGRSIKAGSIGSTIGKLSVCWEKEVSINQHFSVFIFDAKFMEYNLDNENFRINESMALQRYDLTIENLNSLDWTITYPPDERMKNIKMYPPYGSN
jgi:hypothetical protein